MEGFSRMGPRGKPLVRHLLARGIAAPPEAFARLNDRPTLARLVRADPAVEVTNNPAYGPLAARLRAAEAAWRVAAG